MVNERLLFILPSLFGLMFSPPKTYFMLAVFFPHNLLHICSNNGNDALAELGYVAKSRAYGPICSNQTMFALILCVTMILLILCMKGRCLHGNVQ